MRVLILFHLTVSKIFQYVSSWTLMENPLMNYPVFSFQFLLDMSLGMSICQLVDQSTTSIKTEISQYIWYWYTIWYRHLWSQRMNPTCFGDSLFNNIGWHFCVFKFQQLSDGLLNKADTYFIPSKRNLMTSTTPLNLHPTLSADQSFHFSSETSSWWIACKMHGFQAMYPND